MAEQEKKGETKNQRYVPQFYQRYFSIDSKNIGAYAISYGKNILSAPIGAQLSGGYFYPEDMEIEHALGGMEELAKGVIDKVIVNPEGHSTKEKQHALYSSTATREGWTPARVNLIQEYVDTVLRNLVKKQIELLRNNGGAAEVEEIADEVLDGCSSNLK